MADDDVDFWRGPGRHPHGRGPVVEAYAETGALERFCPHCRAAVGDYCTHDGAVQRRMPCPQRMDHNADTGGHQ